MFASEFMFNDPSSLLYAAENALYDLTGISLPLLAAIVAVMLSLFGVMKLIDLFKRVFHIFPYDMKPPDDGLDD